MNDLSHPEINETDAQIFAEITQNLWDAFIEVLEHHTETHDRSQPIYELYGNALIRFTASYILMTHRGKEPIENLVRRYCLAIADSVRYQTESGMR